MTHKERQDLQHALIEALPHLESSFCDESIDEGIRNGLEVITTDLLNHSGKQDKIRHARGRLGDLSRVMEKQGVDSGYIDDDDNISIDDRIDEIYDILSKLID